MAKRGRHYADLLVRILHDGLQPTMAMAQIPMIWGMNQITDHPPMSKAMAELDRVESKPGIVCVSIATSFPLADVPDIVASVYIFTDNNPTVAQSHADQLAT